MTFARVLLPAWSHLYASVYGQIFCRGDVHWRLKSLLRSVRLRSCGLASSARRAQRADWLGAAASGLP